MALSASQVWEVRNTGNDANGGAFKAGSSGTDYSQQNTPQIAVTDAVTNGTTTITSATASFTPAVVGNVAYISGGTGSVTADRYEVTAYINATTITVDRLTGLTAGTGVTLNLGGALASMPELANSVRGMKAKNKAWIKSGTYTQAAVVSFAQTCSPSATVPYTAILGYDATRGDIYPGSANQANRPNILVTTLSADVIATTGNGIRFENLIVGPSGVAACGRGIACGSSLYCMIVNCKVREFNVTGIHAGTQAGVHYCEVSSTQVIGNGIQDGGQSTIRGCWIHDIGSGQGIYSANLSRIIRNIFSNLTGAITDGISAGVGCMIEQNTFYNIGRHGIAYSSSSYFQDSVQGNLFSVIGGYGIKQPTAGWPAYFMLDGNAFHACTSGGRSGIDDIVSNPVDGSGPYINQFDVTLTADPFMARAANDFTLNNLPGGGAAARGAGLPRTWPSLSVTDYSDFGAIQHHDTGGGVNVFYLEG